MAVVWLMLLGAMYWFTSSYLAPQEVHVSSGGTIQLQRARDGHFYADGSIEGVPVRFMVDTGASAIAISDSLAARAGLGSGGREAEFHTANGTRSGRLVKAAEVTVGPLRVHNLTVGTGYTGRTPQDALLGQNFLRQFTVSIRGDVLELSPAQ